VLILRKLGGSVGRSALSDHLHLSTKIKGIAMEFVGTNCPPPPIKTLESRRAMVSG